MKRILGWIGSIFFGLVTLCFLFSLPDYWGGLFFLLPALLLNPEFSGWVTKKIKYKEVPINLAAVIISFVIFGITAPPSTQTGGRVLPTRSEISSQLFSSAAAKEQVKVDSSIAASHFEEMAESAPVPATGAKLKVHYIDVGQGDSEFIELPNGQAILIDAGVADKGETVVSYVKDLGYSKIDYLIATHPHADHIGGMTEVVNAFSIGQMYMPQTSSADTPTTKTYEGLLSAVKEKSIPVHRAKSGVTILKSGNLSANLIAPCNTNYGDLNQYSAVMMLQYGDSKFLFTGDAGNTSENEITADVKADVLKVGHHGSNTSTSQAFLNKVNPKYAVIEVGKGNSYGHPTAATLDKLQKIGATIYRTDQDGTIVFTSDAHIISVDKKASSIKEQAPPASSAAKETVAAPATPKKSTTSGSGQKKVTTPQKPSSKAAAPTQDNQSVTVYITDTGSKYHIAGCQYLRKSKHAISLSDAKSQGYEPCKKCHPPT